MKGRSIASHSINHLGGYTKTESRLDFSGTVHESITRHKRLSTDTERMITENFIYDHQNRLKSHTHKVDNLATEILAQNEYNELSQLTGKKVGGISTGSGLQYISYAYNIRGWMTKINDPANLNGKLFGYELRYNNPENTASSTGRFNGNIAEATWQTASDQWRRRYNYQYDGLNRLLTGIYSEPEDFIPNNNYYNETLTYDLNGNISSLIRNTKDVAGATPMDNLAYNYNGNRLTNVTDSSQNYSGYPDTSGTPIDYDLNGNMTSHNDKGLMQIGYNHLNLPRYVQFNDYIERKGKQYVNITYKYRSDGTKVSKLYQYKDLIIANAFTTKITEYLDGFQYESAIGGSGNFPPTLNFVPTAEGYYNFQNNKYIYNYTDHLGNVRLSYFNNGNGAEVLEENNYYPFGLRHQGYNQTAGNASYQYKFGGKELQETGAYDFGARFYMPDIGRWGVHDPLSSTTLDPYGYAYNNPINIIDPTGMSGTDWVKRGSQVFFDASVKSQADAQSTYGASAQHLGEGSTLTTSVGGEVSSQYTFHDNGTVSDSSGSTLATGSDVTTAGGTTIMGSTNSMFSEGTHSLFAGSSNPNPLEQYRSHRDNPNYNSGESKMDRIFRLMNSSHIEQMRDVSGGFAAGGYGRVTNTALYRAVSPAELGDISASGGLRVSSAGYETGKLFTNSASNASQFGKWLYNWDQTPMTIIRVQVPNSIMRSATNFTADGLPATSIPANQLRAIKSIEALKYSPVAK